MGRPTEPLVERFWSKVLVGDGYWLWVAAINQYGYGVLGINGSTRLAHVIAYETRIGPIPDGLELDHLCRVPNCVRPSHLEPVTHAENVRRGMAGKVNNYLKARTHCSKGHPYDEKNTYVSPTRGNRGCRICRRHETDKQNKKRRIEVMS